MKKLLSIILLLIITSELSAVRCRIRRVVDMSFPNYDVLVPIDTSAQSSFRVRCSNRRTRTKTLIVELSGGNSGSISNRAMNDGNEDLNYNLYHDSGLSDLWGDGTVGSTYVETFTVSNNNDYIKDFTVYGNVPALQDVAANTYSDTITITITW